MSDQRYTDALLANGRLCAERDSLREQLVHFGELHGAEHRAITAENDRLREALETAEYQTQRYKDALDKNASFEQLWEEVSTENDRLREALEDYQARVIPAETRVVELEAENYQLHDAVDRIRKWIDAQQYENDLITVVQLRELLAKEAGE